MAKQSAVEWLLEKLNNVRPTQICSIETIKEWCQQAKAMEKEQIIQAFKEGLKSPYHQDYTLVTQINQEMTKSGQYYQETYVGGNHSVESNEMIDHIGDTNKMVEDDVDKLSFEKELEHLINKHSIDNDCETYDFVLSSFLYSCLQSFKYAIKKREILKAKENTYTEEQVREAIVKASLSDTDSLIDKCDEIIQSLKQNKL